MAEITCSVVTPEATVVEATTSFVVMPLYDGEVGVAVVPGSSFYHDQVLGRTKVRFTFCKRDETLNEAGRRLKTMQAPVSKQAHGVVGSP